LKKIIWYFVFFICFVAVAFSGVGIYNTLSERKECNDTYKTIVSNCFNENLAEKKSQLQELKEETTTTTPGTKTYSAKKSQSVDFSTLLAQNSTAKAWLYLPGTKINYPVAQYSNNSYYLNHLINGRKNSAGALFIDYQNKSDFTDYNTVIYGHSMRNKSMFGELIYYKKQSYYDKHPIMYLFTPESSYILRIFCGFNTDGTSDLYLVPANATLCKELVNYGISHSEFQSNVTVERNDKIVTLSTCSNENKDSRFVVMAKLEKTIN